MKKIFTILFIIMFAQSTYASNNCFVAKEAGKIIKQEGKCDVRHSPYSTFKIVLALMGFDAEILKSPKEPLMEFTQEIRDNLGDLYMPAKYPIQLFGARAQTPESWMKFSVIWYSQEITRELGAEKFADYTKKLNYGNMDVTGNLGKNDGLKSAWIDSSLEISPLEYVDFIEKLSEKKLPLSKKAQKNTIKIMALDKIWDDWKLCGKTGGGFAKGWFVGWIEKDHRRISFVQYLEPPKNSPISGGTMARELAKSNLISLIFGK